MTARVIHADCLDAMRAMPDASIDAVVTDPPYGLSFMGRDWDHGVPGPAFWTEALRVAKPGAHLVAFGGTRTYHRLACAIEDAGWEIRDCLSWLYGSGFPKSLDVSKAIDKLDATDEQKRRRFKFTEWVRSTGATARQIDEATGTRMGGHYTSSASQQAIMTRQHLEACRHLLGDVPEWVEREADIRSVESRNMAERQVVGVVTKGSSPLPGNHDGTWADGQSDGTFNITAPATDAARQWQGWGTALKPAWEPCILARKPIVGTVAANVTAYGTGAINVDACRIGERWPANVALDEEAAAMLDEQSGIARPKTGRVGQRGGKGFGMFDDEKSAAVIGTWPADPGGGASRFFYTAKASRSERNDGCDAIEARPQDPTRDADAPGGNNPRNRGAAPRVNSHPTVKPVALMRWLVRMVTPPGGVVLDPFCGSGSTLVAAIEEGFDCIGVEREAEYVAIIEARVAAAQQRPQRVAKPKPKRQPVKVQPAATAPPTPIASAPLPGQLALAWGAE